MARVRLSPDSIRAILEEGGWPCHRIAEDTFRSLFQGKHASFPFFVRIDPAGFVVFAIVPYLRSPEEQARAAKLYTRLLELNQTLLMAKFSIDDDLDVVLSVEYALPELDRSEFDDALDVLSYYADRHYDELRALATPPLSSSSSSSLAAVTGTATKPGAL
ncbi:MAG: YbjN domain-containing protein [Myxococcota bacterium]|nr:YbjN domain-containing protein [Myxococcota bacterium]